MRAFYCDQFVLPLPPQHRFPMLKYSRLRERVAKQLTPALRLHVPEPTTWEEITRAHDPDYARCVLDGTLTPAELRRIGFPWSPELVERSRRSSGGTIAACRSALEDGLAVNLAGGTHHAFADRGEGFCVFNDSVIAARAMQVEGKVRRVVILDCDVHQGNGTAALCRDDRSIYTFSIHGAKNFPFRKEISDLDIELPDKTGDDHYLDRLRNGIRVALTASRADLAIYLAGADPLAGDRFGRMALTKQGLAERDRLVLDECQSHGLPVAITMAGGYSPVIEDIVDVHFHTVMQALSR